MQDPGTYFTLQNETVNKTPVRPILPTAAAVVILSMAAAGCNAIQNPAAAATAAQKSARLLAGMPADHEQTALQKKLRSSDHYARFARRSTELWQNLDRRVLQKMKPWSERHTVPYSSGRAAFYPLSGADFVNLHGIYPEAGQYFMFAMEKPGSWVEIESLPVELQKKALQTLESQVSEYINNNYFKSKEMRRTMNHPRFEGVLPAVLWFSQHMGFTVRQHDDAWLHKSGKIIYSALKPAAGETVGPKGDYAPGFRLIMSKNGRTQTLHYFNLFLSNAQTDSGGSLYRLFHAMSQKPVLLFKAAVYLMHYNFAVKLKDFFVENASFIVQDDSGIPFNAFDSKKWNLQFFGGYTWAPPLTGRPSPQQDGLKKAFSSGAQPLPFPFGYGVWVKSSNLMTARRKVD